MSKLSKRQKLFDKIELNKQYSIMDAINLLKQLPVLKFKESIDVNIMLGIDANKSEQIVRGSVVLPHGIGKKVKIAVFAQNEQEQLALDAGADFVGLETLVEKIKSGFVDFDIVIATPDTMSVVGQLGQILGPRGLMPNPKLGTVTTDVVVAIQNARNGQIRYRSDKGGIIHGGIGKIDFSSESLLENLVFLLKDLYRVKPTGTKGQYIKKIVLTSTMGPGLIIDQASLLGLL